jgi:hypothetical protein
MGSQLISMTKITALTTEASLSRITKLNNQVGLNTVSLEEMFKELC